MKTWNDLSDRQQKRAVEARLNWLLTALCEGRISFKDEATTAGVERARVKSEQMRTPWFMHEYVMDEIGDLLTQVASDEAMYILYAESHEVVMPEPIETDD